MEEEGIIGLCVGDEPVHSVLHILLGGNLARILLVVRQDHHVLPLIAVTFVQEPRHIVHIVDAAAQLALLTKVVNADEQGLATTTAVGVLEGVALRRAVTKLLRALRRRRSRALAAVAATATAAAHGIAVGVVAGRRRSVRGRVLVLLRRRAAVLRRRGRAAVVTLRRSVALLRRRTSVTLLRTSVAVLGRRAAVSLRRRRTTVAAVLGRTVVAVSGRGRAAVAEARGTAVVLLCAVAALAWVSRHDGETRRGGWVVCCEVRRLREFNRFVTARGEFVRGCGAV